MAECLKAKETPLEGAGQIKCIVYLQSCVHPAQLFCGHTFCFLCIKGIANQRKRCAMCRQEISSDFLDHPSQIECAVCLQSCVHPAQLPCGHIFCFLCVKGIANQSKRCAMCRQEIPSDFLDHPKLLDSLEQKEGEEFEGGYQWFYEGRNGWWKYDERTNEEIEEAFKKKINNVQILICGKLYIVDFALKVQYPHDAPSRKRYIKRDLRSITAKGVAGLPQY